ncbi:MAG: Gfo/Idh/MocA family oxidoreductase, partial [Ignavibacteriales bacterium]|nr:Gfo/Idh/MocA family oxidoreductase [Ignavibacteriales bacterium]
NVSNVRLVGIATKTGLSSQHVGNRFGFEYATSEYQKVLNDDNIGSIVISTRHNLHAKLVSEALAAGKNVFVEKPLCIRREDIDLLVDSFNKKPREVALMVGFNRRYSPLSENLKDVLSNRVAPLQAHVRVNASFIPPEHWTQDPNIGGGRIIGEVCHFVDYLQYLTNSDPIEVFATSIAGSLGKYQSGDNVVITLRFADGSLGSITYTALGTKTFSRERVELFWDESAAVLEDFRSFEYSKGTSKKKKKLWNQDMGYKNELADFFSTPIEQSNERFRQAILTTLVTFGATESLRSHRPVAVAEVRI